MKITFRLLVISVLFVTCLLTANIIGSKVFSVGTISLPAAVIVFPFSYIFGDILTEVYGYKRTRKIIWLGFLCNLIFVLFAWLGKLLPPAASWGNQPGYEAILGYTPRLLAASFAGYIVGEFANSFVLAKMKIFTKGRWLWSRTVASTVVGEGLDTVIFIFGTFYGTPVFTPVLMLNHWVAKVGIEILATPATYRVINSLKKSEGMDTFDTQTNFNPLALREKQIKPETK